MRQLSQSTVTFLHELSQKRKPHEKIAFVSGIFNVIHPGHLRIFRFAADRADYLIVGLKNDKEQGVIIPQDLRLESVKAVGCVNFALVLEDPLLDFLEALQADYVVKGKEHEGGPNPELAVVQKYNGKLLFSAGEIQFSSRELLKSEFGRDQGVSITQPCDFLERHQISKQKMLQTIDNMQKLNVCIIGDTIVDEYITCNPLGMSQEDPTLVVSPIFSEKFIGGAAIVASHAKGMGATVDFFSVLGEDQEAQFVHETLEKNGLNTHFIEDSSRPTTLKQRYRAKSKTLLRVNRLLSLGLSKELIAKLYEKIEAKLTQADLVLFADFNHGCLPQELVERIVTFCSRNKIPMFADSQSSSQIGDISRFRGMNFVTPTEREARLALQDHDSGLPVLARKLCHKSEAKTVLITLAEEGIFLYSGLDQQDKWESDRLPALNRNPKDVAGAGDSLFVVSAMASVLGCSIWESAYLGSLAAACQVSRIGNIAVTVKELKNSIQ